MRMERHLILNFLFKSLYVIIIVEKQRRKLRKAVSEERAGTNRSTPRDGVHAEDTAESVPQTVLESCPCTFRTRLWDANVKRTKLLRGRNGAPGPHMEEACNFRAGEATFLSLIIFRGYARA